ncbi:hypothetical protein HK096_005946 [Nowakowskiella sp. JEL0078]|nr:hypothetical protein HK096_005946 [Nowakowskiella sp. JEL0078]
MRLMPSESGKILVLGALIEAGESANDQLLRQLIPRLPIGPAGTKTELHRLNLRSIINFFANSPWNTYEGSLTTPPCTEGVRFFIAANYLRVGEAQLRELKKVVKFSARYTQPYNGRGEE